MAKKEKAPITLVRDLLVKLGNIYKDFYLYKGKYCIGGKKTEEDAFGTIVCTLESPYDTAMETFVGKEELYYCEIKPFKDWIDSVIKEGNPLIEDVIHTITFIDILKIQRKKSIIEEIDEKISNVIENFSENDVVWKNLGEYTDLVKTVFTDKQIFNLPVSKIIDDLESNDYITISKQLLPVITDKTVGDSFIYLKKLQFESEELYEVYIDFLFTHFKMQCVYHVIPISFYR